jgi:ribose-phosphate pyrophosphokinase
MIDTAGTLKNAAQAVKEGGAERVYAVATHAVLSGPAAERIGSSVLEKVIVTDTIPLSPAAAATGKIVQVSAAELLGEAIRSVHSNDSVTRLFR